ncbi:hypothetical protein, partial [uncultured Sphingomonas sp.]|uniref:hypothetical protein n=1 Tax=uncultured Sphingomonas sp. TaxID=158754 RepID=UPI0026000627
GFYLLFADTHEVGLHRPFTPHWVGEMADRRTLEAAVRWFARRRDRWQAWGALAKVVGHATFERHMRECIAADPFETVVGSFVQIVDDLREILVGEVLDRENGTRLEVLHRHRFKSVAAHGRFCAWFEADHNFERIDAIVALGYQEGAGAVAAALDDIASEAAVRSAQEAPGAAED